MSIKSFLLFVLIVSYKPCLSNIINSTLNFHVDETNSLSLTVVFKTVSATTDTTFLLLLPFQIRNDNIVHSKNCIVSSYHIEKSSLLFIRIFETNTTINIVTQKISKIPLSADNTMREEIDFSFKDINNKILNSLMNSGSFLNFNNFKYKIDFSTDINSNTIIVKPNENGTYIDILRNQNKLIIQYSNPLELELTISQSLMAFMVSIVTLILTLFFVDLDKIRVSNKKTIGFTVVISLFIILNILIAIGLYIGMLVNILLPLVSFMSPNSLAFVFLLINLFHRNDSLGNSEPNDATNNNLHSESDADEIVS